MLQSMTGFGSASGSVQGVEYAVEIRSVNNRYFKAGIKLPEIWSSAEPEIEKFLREKLSRGSVLLTVRMKLPDDQAAYRVNVAALNRYLEQVKLVMVEGDPLLRIDLGAMLNLPGICEPPPLEELCQTTHGGLMALVGQAVDGLTAMRQIEGQAVQAELDALCAQIDKSLAVVVQRAPQVVLDYHARLTARVAELTAAARVTIDASSLAREVALFAERCDLAEEISRLSGHVEQFRSAMRAPEPAGRKLDFIAQEMLREANTIASKANDAQIAWAVVDVKTAIDRIKEQVQNVE